MYVITYMCMCINYIFHLVFYHLVHKTPENKMIENKLN
jgi:hypothetical protein